MSTVVTIFVRNSAACKYVGDEFHKGCRCRKHLRWSKDGKQYRITAGTRSWEGAERDGQARFHCGRTHAVIAHWVLVRLGRPLPIREHTAVGPGTAKEFSPLLF